MEEDQRNTSVTDLALALGLLVRRLRAATGAHDLSLTERAVVARLAREGPATTSDLARAESVRPQSMGATIAALEEMRLVQRRPHPTDRRQVHIVLTDLGAAVREETRTAKQVWLAEAISRLSEDEQRMLFQAGEIMKRLGES